MGVFCNPSKRTGICIVRSSDTTLLMRNRGIVLKAWAPEIDPLHSATPWQYDLGQLNLSVP